MHIFDQHEGQKFRKNKTEVSYTQFLAEHLIAWQFSLSTVYLYNQNYVRKCNIWK